MMGVAQEEEEGRLKLGSWGACREAAAVEMSPCCKGRQ